MKWQNRENENVQILSVEECLLTYFIDIIVILGRYAANKKELFIHVIALFNSKYDILIVFDIR